MSDNTGHRQRVKQRFRAEGLEDFHEIHVLELLLFYAMPRVDTKPLARRLIDRFGSFAAVMEATPQELEEVERNLIVQRYFQEKTQTQVAEALGISQVRVSRMEKKILLRMRKMME